MRLVFSRNPLAWIRLPVILKHRIAAYIDWKAFTTQFVSTPTIVLSRQGRIRGNFTMDTTTFSFEDRPLPIHPDTNLFTFLVDKPGLFTVLRTILEDDAISVVALHADLFLLFPSTTIVARCIPDRLLEKGYSEEEAARILLGDLPFPDLQDDSCLVAAPVEPSLDMPLIEWCKWPEKLRDFLETTFMLDPGHS